MVVQRTIENLRERPHNERRAVALGVSIFVMLVLFIGWGTFFVRQMTTIALTPTQSVYDQVAQTASAAAASDDTGWFSESPTQVVPQESNDRIEVIEQSDEQDPSAEQFLQ